MSFTICFHGLYGRLFRHLFGDHVKHGGIVGLALLAFVGTLLLATLSFRFFESPFLRLKSRFAA